jgi:hypothetical protein
LREIIPSEVNAASEDVPQLAVGHLPRKKPIWGLLPSNDCLPLISTASYGVFWLFPIKVKRVEKETLFADDICNTLLWANMLFNIFVMRKQNGPVSRIAGGRTVLVAVE